MPNNSDTLVDIFEDIGSAMEDNLGLTGPWTPAQMAPAISGYNTHAVEDSLIDRSISGSYTNDRVTVVSFSAFKSCHGITAAKFGSATRVRSLAFNDCVSLSYAEFPKLATIDDRAFADATDFATLNLYSPSRSSIPTLANTLVFRSTEIEAGTGYIVINDDLVNTLKGATNWVTYASQIIGYTDWQALQS